MRMELQKSWKQNRIWIGLFAMLMVFGLCPVSAKAAGSVTVTLPDVHMFVTGETPAVSESFKATISADEGSNPMPAVTQVQAVAGETKNLGTAVYTGVGYYHYTLTLLPGTTPGYTYDTTSYKITVIITNDGAGNLKSQVVIADANDENAKYAACDFYNAYRSSTTPIDTDDLLISNQVTGAAPAADRFDYQINFDGIASGMTFVYVDQNGVRLGLISSGDIISLTSGESIKILGLPIGTGYEIIQGQKAYYTINPITGIWTGNIVKGGNKAPFINHYDINTPAPVSVDPPVEKVISGDKPAKESTFTFIMKALVASNPMPPDSQNGEKIITIKGEGKGEFGFATYTAAGVYEYNIQERKEDITGYTFDTTVYTMKVTVTDKDGRLTENRVLTDAKGQTAKDTVFTNHYSSKITVNNTSGGGTTNNTTSNVVQQIITAVKTGDTSSIMLYAGCLIICGGVVILLAVLKRRKRQEEDY